MQPAAEYTTDTMHPALFSRDDSYHTLSWPVGENGRLLRSSTIGQIVGDLPHADNDGGRVFGVLDSTKRRVMFLRITCNPVRPRLAVAVDVMNPLGR